MITSAPEILVRRGLDRGLIATIVASAAIHVGVLVLLLVFPGRLLHSPPKLHSYTVDLVAPDVVGGTNLIPGGGKAKPADKPVELAKAPPPAAAKPAGEPVAEPIKEPAKAAEPPKPAAPEKAPEAPKPVAAVKPPEPAPPPVQKVAPPPEPPPKAVAEKAPEKPAAPPKPSNVEPKPADKPAEVKPVAKAEVPKPPPNPPQPAKVEAKPAHAVKPAAVPAKPSEVAKPQTKPTESSEAAAARAAKQRDDQIAAAVQKRGAQVRDESAKQSEVDKQITAAVQRRAQQVGAGSGSGAPGPGGPVSVGPGTGAGGTAAGLEYILYQGRMEQKIKAAWAWAGADRSLQAVIQFNLAPDGQISNVRTTQSSGDRQYDASCERAVRAANPLEPVPEKYRKEFATVEMTFKPTDVE